MKKNALSKGREGFTSGVFILTFSAIAVKVLGLIYKIPMLKLIGSEGMGYFNTAYELYAVFCIISSAGLPVAMSVHISSDSAKDGKNIGRIFSVSLTVFAVIGVAGSLMMAIFARQLSWFLKSEKAYLSILAISPAVLFMCLTGALRGYFQGMGRMLPTAISQVLEAVFKVILGILFAYLALHYGKNTEYAAAYAVFGLSVGMLVSVIYLVLAKKRAGKDRGLPDLSRKKVMKGLLSTSVPVTLSSLVLSVTKIADMTLILRRLQSIGYTEKGANIVWGSYTTLALPLFSLAPTLITSIALPLVPAVSKAYAEGNIPEQKRIIDCSFGLCTAFVCPAGVGLSLFSGEILSLIFPGEYEAISIASPLLSLLGLSVMMSGIITVQNATLQAYSKAKLPIVSMAIGAAIKVLSAYILIGIPSVGIAGAPISTLLTNLFITSLNFYFLYRTSPDTCPTIKIFTLPFACSVTSIGVSLILLRVAQKSIGQKGILTLSFIALSAMLYIVMVKLTGVFDNNEMILEKVPFLKKKKLQDNNTM